MDKGQFIYRDSEVTGAAGVTLLQIFEQAQENERTHVAFKPKSGECDDMKFKVGSNYYAGFQQNEEGEFLVPVTDEDIDGEDPEEISLEGLLDAVNDRCQLIAVDFEGEWSGMWQDSSEVWDDSWEGAF